ncbi:MAG TPA: tetratricopeptide repeat protein [Gammaproteobacteria bacterium]|nr:tetratricopeptide repeat protein [Gammaproteobacteria bacterium]
MRSRFFQTCIALAALALQEAHAASLEEAVALARSGATELALRVIDAGQPPADGQGDEWSAWEKERIRILQAQRDWQAVEQRLHALPANVAPSFRAWALAVRAEAALERGEPARALEVLRELIWNAPAEARGEEARWRRLVIRAYLHEGRYDDALAAIQRFRQDYPLSAGEWTGVQAEILLRQDRAGEALALLTSDRDRGSPLALLAALRARADKPATVLERAVKMAVAKATPDDDRRRYWTIAAEAAASIGNLGARIAALERAVTFAGGEDRLFTMHADDLWDTYLDFGIALGNEQQLLIGDDAEWFVAASNLYDRNPLAARALFCVVAFHAHQPSQRDIAHGQFAALLAREPQGGAVLYALYLRSRHFSAPEAVPAPVRYLLVDYVLQQLGDIPLASRLMQDLDTPPEGVPPGEWHLRRARVFLLGGRVEEGIAVLETLFANEAPPVEYTRLLQVLFDLQNLGRHREAVGFLERLLARDITGQARRELLFWAADSWGALGDHIRAARLYMRSATLEDPFAMDPWAQTARYRAAEALAAAGLYGDARRLFTSLLNATSDPSRQAVLRQQLQQLVPLERARREPDAQPAPGGTEP